MRSSQVILYRHRTSGMNVVVDEIKQKHASSMFAVSFSRQSKRTVAHTSH